MLHLGVIRSR